MVVLEICDYSFFDCETSINLQFPQRYYSRAIISLLFRTPHPTIPILYRFLLKILSYNRFASAAVIDGGNMCPKRSTL